MKTLLLITVCEQNKDRILNQLACLNKFNSYIQEHNITPVFVYGNTEITVDVSPYEKWQVNVEEAYDNLYKKIFLSFERALKENFDYLIKIDDDTLFNINLFHNIKLDVDCIGRIQEGYSANYLHLDLPMYNIKKSIQLFPTALSKTALFFTGDFYILSRAVIEFLIKNKLSVFEECTADNNYLPEDQLIGYALKDQWEVFTKKDISLVTEETILNVLQITNSVISLHPVHTNLFKSLLELSPEEQLAKFTNQRGTNYWYRKSLLTSLETNLKKVLVEFLNSNKLMGMG